MHLLKLSLLVQIGGEILAPLCSDDSVKILVKLDWIVTFAIRATIQANFQRICMESSEHNCACNLLTNLHQQSDCWKEGFFHLVISEYANKSHNFTNLNFCDVTIPF